VKAKTHRNVTLSLPEDLLKQIKILAAQKDTSISALMREQLELLIPEEEQRLAAANRLIERMTQAKDRGVMGKVTWTREDIYDRHER
jgi:plasmid stability protein